MEFRERVGQNINHYRKLNGLTLKEIASRVGITEATMQKYEAGQIKRVDIDMIGKIAKALGISPSTLLDWNVQSSQEFIDLFSEADPGVQEAVVTLLKSSRPAP
jgi:transcriptional regulator with XRE-family HTH domain